MAVIEGGVSAALAGVGAESGSPMHVYTKPDTVGALGHYRSSHRFVIANTQAANARLFEFQNPTTNLYIVHHVLIQVLQTGTFTAAIEDSFDMFRLTGFTAVDTTNTVTPGISKLRTSFAASGAAIRGVTQTGASAGMTGGTLAKDANALKQLTMWFLAAVPTTVPTNYQTLFFKPEVCNGESPLILAQNEGYEIENRVLLGAAAAASVYIDTEWSEVTAY